MPPTLDKDRDLKVAMRKTTLVAKSSTFNGVPPARSSPPPELPLLSAADLRGPLSAP